MATMDKSGASVFEPGNHAVEGIELDADDAAPAPTVPVLIVAPKDAGTYPVVMLLHGFLLRNHYYQHLLRHVASHGYITVAPQFSVSNSVVPPLGDGEDVAAAARVADWLPGGLPSVLPDGVEPELSMLALAGHSRGGHTAFAMALGHGETRLVSFSALIGLDPVVGAGRSAQLPPEILTYEPSSFDTLTAGMPVLVVGTGLGEEGKGALLPPCAPADVGHVEFYRECRPPCYHLVARDYGHLDLLDDDAPALVTGLVCESGEGPRDAMRRCVAGIMVAFLNVALGAAEDGDLEAIVRDPAVAPAVLDPVKHHMP